MARAGRLGLGLLAAAACLLAAAPRHGRRGSGEARPLAFAPGRRPTLRAPPGALPGLRAEKSPPKPKSQDSSYTVNEDIKYTEVRLVGEVSDDPNQSEMLELNEVLYTSDALTRAKSRGLDLVLVNEAREPPLVKIVKLSKFEYLEKKRAKERARQGKQPKLKEVKISYTIGDHDLNTKLKQVGKWLTNQRQQVRITVMLKGRSRMFEKQAQELLLRIQKEVASFAKAAGSVKTNSAIAKDGAGNLYIMLSSGSDPKILKMIVAEAEAADDEEDRDEDDLVARKPRVAGSGSDDDGEVSEELLELQAELEEVKQELLDCGISPGQLSQQPEFIDVMQQIQQLEKDTTAAGAFSGGRHCAPPAGALCAAGLVLAAAVSSAALPRRPRLRQACRQSR